MRTPRPWTLPTQPATRALLRGSGVSDAMIRTQLAAGRILQVRHGVFVSADTWPEEDGLRHLVRAHAEQVANPAAVMSHESAAVAWGLRTPRFAAWHDHPVALTVPTSARATRRRDVVWHTRALPPGQVTRDKDGYALTTLARTAVDLAAGLELPDALVIVDHAARLILASYVSAKPRRKDFLNTRLVEAARRELAQAVGRPERGVARAIELAEPCRESVAGAPFLDAPRRDHRQARPVSGSVARDVVVLGSKPAGGFRDCTRSLVYGRLFSPQNHAFA